MRVARLRHRAAEAMPSSADNPENDVIRGVCEYVCGSVGLCLMANRERHTFSLDGTTVARIRQCAASNRGGASGYIERLVRDDAMRAAVAQLEQFHHDNPAYAEDSLSEQAAAQAQA